MSTHAEDKELFLKLKKQLLMLDPCAWVEEYLTLDGKPFRLHGNGYKPMADIYRYIGVKALEPKAKPVIITKGRQVGMTTAASALEMYFMGSGIFGVGDNPPIRVIHAFPQLELAAAYSKTKLNQMIISSVPAPGQEDKKATKPKSYMQSLLDHSSSTNDSLHFKQFINGNHLWIESTGLDADRIMGRMIALDTDIPTPTGFIKLTDLKEGDQLFDENGNICNVTKLHPIDNSPESYKITFDDGTIVEACADHLWLTYTKLDRENKTKPKVKNTKDILLTLKVDNENNHSIPCPVFKIKSDRILPDENNVGKKNYRFIVSIESMASKPMRCITVDSTSNLFLITKEFIPTHNTADVLFFDECFVAEQKVTTNEGNYSFGKLYKLFTKNEKLPLVKSYNEELNKFEYKKIINVFKRGINNLIEINCSGRKIKCTPNHKFLTEYGWQEASTIVPGTKIKSSIDEDENYSWLILNNIKYLDAKKQTYDIEVEDNHNFVLAPNKNGPTLGGPIAHNCQKTTSQAIGNALKILTTAKYGKPSKGVQVYFGTPRRKGSDFHKMWNASSQQYYYLGCEKCEKHFPLYTPGSEDWEKVWLHGFIVKCPHCGSEQDKRQAAERGKWMTVKGEDTEDCLMVGFHINQLYMPFFTKEDIIKEKPGIHPINTERVFQNEVLGEFFQGDSSPMTIEEIRELCSDVGRKFAARLDAAPPGNSDNRDIIVMGIDYGAKADLEQLANPDRVKSGQSYSTAVILKAKGPKLLSIEFATKFKRNDIESKRGIIDQLMRQYGIQLAVGDIGYSNDFSEILHNAYGDRYIVSRAHNKVNNYVKYNQDAYPKEIVFERDHYISEIYDFMKKGQIRFPFGDYEKIAWLIEHCASMEIKPSISRAGEPSIHYVKGGTPNDGFMALLNAYIAYKFIITKGFTNNNPLLYEHEFSNKNKPLVLTGHISRRF